MNNAGTMFSLRQWLKNRTISHDFKAVVKLQQAHVDELISRHKDIPYEVLHVTAFLLEENIELYKSIATLLRQGYFQPCLVLGRTILENTIKLQYIFQKDTETRAKNYMVHSFVNTLERMKKAGVDEFDEGEVSEQINELKKEFQKSGSRDYYWDGKSFKEICEILGHNWVYESWYSRLSKYTHSQYKGHRGFEERRPYNDFMRKLILRDMVVLTLEALKSINEKYELLEGGAIITDYPYEGATLAFSISSKKTDEETTRIMEEQSKKKK